MNYIVFDGSKDPSCAKCRFRNGEICVATGEKRLYQICPIRTLPTEISPIQVLREQTRVLGDSRLAEEVSQEWCDGWNECLREIVNESDTCD